MGVTRPDPNKRRLIHKAVAATHIHIHTQLRTTTRTQSGGIPVPNPDPGPYCPPKKSPGLGQGPRGKDTHTLLLRKLEKKRHLFTETRAVWFRDRNENAPDAPDQKVYVKKSWDGPREPGDDDMYGRSRGREHRFQSFFFFFPRGPFVFCLTGDKYIS